MTTPKGLTYAQAGVSIEAGDELVRRIGPIASKTKMPGVLAGVGGFSALFDLQSRGYRHPVLVSSTDGVGTKLKIAFMTGIHDTVGIDLVAMGVNDILTQGAAPLFFLDYFVCGKLDVDIAEAVVRGIAAGCRQAGCALIGGETAEHPGDFPKGEYDLAGFVVGVLEKKKMIDPAAIVPGDVLIGIPFQRSAQQRLFAGAQGFAGSGSDETSPAHSRARPQARRGVARTDAHLRKNHRANCSANFRSKARRISPAAASSEICREYCRNGRHAVIERAELAGAADLRS